MPVFLTLNLIDGSVEFPTEFVLYSGLLSEFVQNAYDVDSTEDGWLQEIIESEETSPLDFPMLTTREVSKYLEWCRIRPYFENSAKLDEYTNKWKEQMQLQKPHIPNPVPETPLPDRVENSWTIASLVTSEELPAVNALFKGEYDDLITNATDAPSESPYLNPPNWVLNLPAHDIPEDFPRELIGYWLKEYHFIELNGLEIPDDLILNAFIRTNIRGDEEQNQDTYDAEMPIVIDYICQHLSQLTMPELPRVVPDHTIADEAERNADVMQRIQENHQTAERRIRDTIFIPSKFPEELQEPWLSVRFNDPGGFSEEAVQEYHETNNRFLEQVPHTCEEDPLWGIGAEIGELALLGAEKFLDPWLESVAAWRLSEMTDNAKNVDHHMRMMKYYNTARVRQYMEACYVYTD